MKHKRLVIVLLTLVFVGVIGFGAMAKLQFSLTTPVQAIPSSGVPQEALGQFYSDHKLELYTLYYDFDSDGDIDVAVGTGGPIRIIENRTVENQPAAVAAPTAGR